MQRCDPCSSHRLLLWLRHGLALALLALPGCAAFRGAPEPPFRNTQANLEQLEALYSGTAVVECLQRPLAAEAPDRHRECRDSIIQALMLGIDVRYAEFEIGLLNDNRYIGTAAAAIGLGLNAAGAVSPAGSARALAAAAAGVAGLRERADSELLLRSTMAALQTAMQARRAERRLSIITGLRQTSGVYPLGSALSDVLAYYRAGTLVGATIGVNDAVAQQWRAARARTEELIGVPQLAAPAAMTNLAVQQPAPLRQNPPGAVPGAVPAPIRPEGFQPVARTPSSLRLRACLAPSLPVERRRDTRHAIATALNVETLSARDTMRLLTGPDAAEEARRMQALANPAVQALCAEPAAPIAAPPA